MVRSGIFAFDGYQRSTLTVQVWQSLHSPGSRDDRLPGGIAAKRL